MEINTHYIKVPKTARYATYGILSEKTKYYWFCLHGTKMVCEQMVYKFSEFDPEEHYVVSAEGMSRMYKEGFGGDVVATWMTSRDRLHEIDDFSYYLTTLYNQQRALLPQNVKKIVFGFSQGGTTTFRWLHNTEVDVDLLLAHSCWIPEDIDLSSGATGLSDIDSVYTYGNEDPFINEERIKIVEGIISKNNLNINMELFEGGHKIYKEQLKYLVGKYL